MAEDGLDSCAFSLEVIRNHRSDPHPYVLREVVLSQDVEGELFKAIGVFGVMAELKNQVHLGVMGHVESTISN